MQERAEGKVPAEIFSLCKSEHVKKELKDAFSNCQANYASGVASLESSFHLERFLSQMVNFSSSKREILEADRQLSERRNEDYYPCFGGVSCPVFA